MGASSLYSAASQDSIWDRRAFHVVRSEKFDEAIHSALAALEQSRVVQNRGTLLLARLLGIEGTVHLKEGFTIRVNRSNITTAINLIRLSYFGASLTSTPNARWRSWTVSLEEGTIQTPEGLRFWLDSIEPAIFAETYIHQIHFLGFDLKGKVVIDVGGFVGDTALYFAMHGAKVIVYEPDPINFLMLKKNIELNDKISDQITIWNKAVGKLGRSRVAIGLKGGSGIYASSARVLDVPSVDLETILKENHLDRAHVLKLDSKGTEFELFSQTHIYKFDLISCEYSADVVGRSPVDLIESLKRAGFTHFRVFKHNCFYYHLQDHGTIQAAQLG